MNEWFAILLLASLLGVASSQLVSILQNLHEKKDIRRDKLHFSLLVFVAAVVGGMMLLK